MISGAPSPLFFLPMPAQPSSSRSPGASADLRWPEWPCLPGFTGPSRPFLLRWMPRGPADCIASWGISAAVLSNGFPQWRNCLGAAVCGGMPQGETGRCSAGCMARRGSSLVRPSATRPSLRSPHCMRARRAFPISRRPWLRPHPCGSGQCVVGGSMPTAGGSGWSRWHLAGSHGSRRSIGSRLSGSNQAWPWQPMGSRARESVPCTGPEPGSLSRNS